MSTTPRHDESLASALFGKTRRAVLGVLYGHPDEALYLREVARATGAGLGATQRELKRLSESGIVRRSVRGTQVFYQANRSCPIYEELRRLVVKTVGVAEVLRSALAPLGARIRVAFVFGSFAAGEPRQGSDVDLVVAGNVTLGEVVSALAGAQSELGREINPVVYPAGEFREKLKARHHFLTSVLQSPKIFVTGDEHALARMAPERLAGRAQNKFAGNHRPAGRRRT